MSGTDGERPKGWHGKAAKAERKAEREARRAERGNGRAPDPAAQAIRDSARRRLERLPSAGSRDAGSTVAGAFQREKQRVAGILARDRADARKGRLRDTALDAVKSGKTANAQDTVIGPTREQLGDKPDETWRPVDCEKLPGSVASVQTLRRVTANRVKQLYDRGVFDDDLYPAVLWYQRQFEACGMSTGPSAAAWGEQIRGQPAYGLMPKTAAQAEARHLFRFARGGQGDGFELPPRMLVAFDAVVLDELTIDAAALLCKVRYATAKGMIRHVALMLRARIAHLLPVRDVGAPGSGPAETLPEIVAFCDGPAAGTFAVVDPLMLDARGMFRAADEIAAIARGRGLGLSDDKILGLLDGERG